MMVRLRHLGSCAVLLLIAVSASGQALPSVPDTNTVRVRFGPLYLNPSAALTNAGIDNNVFNSPDQLAPQSDFTMTVTPAADWWVRFGRTWFAGNFKEDLVWYQDFVNQRSANSNFTANWLVPLNRISFSVGGNWINTKERPGFEIDARARRLEDAGNGVVEIRALSKTFFGARAERRHVDYQQDETFLGNNLRFELNRTMTSAGLTARNQLTPLTSVTFSAGRQEDRFEFSPLRDSDSTRLLGGMAFDPFALIKGSFQIGYRDFRPLAPDLPGYSGSVADAALSYVVRGSTKLTVNVLRDIQYSYDVNQPYYLQTGVNGQLSQQIYGPLDIEVRLGTARLDYTTRDDVTVAVPDRTDRYRGWGAGVGYRVARDLRLGFNVDTQRRESDLPIHQYDGIRWGFAVTYGL